MIIISLVSVLTLLAFIIKANSTPRLFDYRIDPDDR